jgi:hypothetical protein
VTYFKVILLREIITVCSDNHIKHTNTPRGQNAELLNVKASGTYGNHCAVKDRNIRMYN